MFSSSQERHALPMWPPEPGEWRVQPVALPYCGWRLINCVYLLASGLLLCPSAFQAQSNVPASISVWLSRLARNGFQPTYACTNGTSSSLHPRNLWAHSMLCMSDTSILSSKTTMLCQLSKIWELCWVQQPTFHCSAWLSWQFQYKNGTKCDGAEPNGYLQWDEVNPEANYIAKIDPAASTPALENLFKKFSVPKGEGGAAE